MKKELKTITTENLTDEITAGKIFIYPTDTIYGLGCNAEDKIAVEKIKSLKGRDRDKPLSIIAPSFEWILENFKTDKKELKKYLPGPYTLLLEKKDLNFLSHISPNSRIGVRVPKLEIIKSIQESGLPFVTTSVNLSGEPFALKFSDIPTEIIDKVDYIIKAENENKLSGKPSTLIIDGKEMERK